MQKQDFRIAVAGLRTIWLVDIVCSPYEEDRTTLANKVDVLARVKCCGLYFPYRRAIIILYTAPLFLAQIIHNRPCPVPTYSTWAALVAVARDFPGRSDRLQQTEASSARTDLL